MKKRNKSIKKEQKKITTEELDELFDNGGDITPYLDLENTRYVFRVNVDFPVKVLDSLDKEADRIGVSRQALIKMWIAEKTDALVEKQKKPTKKSVS